MDYDIKTNDPNVAAGVLKLWFRELKPPLVPPDYYDECLINSTKPDVLQKMIDEKFPAVNKEIFYFMLRWLRILAKEEYSSKTMMGIDNLAMVFAPSFLRCPKTAIMMFNAAKEKEVVETLLKHTCFSPDEKRTPPPLPGPPPPLPALPPALSGGIPPLAGPPSGASSFRARLLTKYGDAPPPATSSRPPDAPPPTPPRAPEDTIPPLTPPDDNDPPLTPPRPPEDDDIPPPTPSREPEQPQQQESGEEKEEAPLGSPPPFAGEAAITN